ncbi:putative thiopurine S-methyltransferase [Pseudolycoriella hygida]|uniref:thiopurine S-methyltransferase n=1 Tax=Pseudolycoriella hygida TaxID=35572 RepID=A0A9Q0S8R6_9DIPT|nr:putative thiopurine S-methyltransferase [Pseudolycoriella hygida]
MLPFSKMRYLILILCLCKLQVEASDWLNRTIQRDLSLSLWSEDGQERYFVQTEKTFNAGANATNGQYPWTFYIIAWSNIAAGSWTGEMCSSSIISQNFALTAFYCLEPQNSMLLRPVSAVEIFVGGVSYIYRPGISQGFMRRLWYIEPSTENSPNIVLLQFHETLTFNPNIHPIRLPAPGNFSYEGWSSFATGFNRPGPVLNAVKQFSSISILRNDECNFFNNLTDYDMCTLDLGPETESPSFTFTGGAWVAFEYDDFQYRSTLVGIHRNEFVDETSNRTVGIATRVSHFVEWIEELTKNCVDLVLIPSLQQNFEMAENLDYEGNVNYWSDRWAQAKTGWHRSDVNKQLIEFVRKFCDDGTSKRFFVPLCGKTVDIPFLYAQGHSVFGVEAVAQPVEELNEEHSLGLKFNSESSTYSSGDGKITIYCGDIFTCPFDKFGTFDCVWDRGSFVAFDYPFRPAYMEMMKRSLKANGEASDEKFHNFKYLMEVMEYDRTKFPGPPRAVDIEDMRTFFGGWANIEVINRGLEEFKALPELKTLEVVHYLLTPKISTFSLLLSTCFLFTFDESILKVVMHFLKLLEPFEFEEFVEEFTLQHYGT